MDNCSTSNKNNGNQNLDESQFGVSDEEAFSDSSSRHDGCRPEEELLKAEDLNGLSGCRSKLASRWKFIALSLLILLILTVYVGCLVFLCRNQEKILFRPYQFPVSERDEQGRPVNRIKIFNWAEDVGFYSGLKNSSETAPGRKPLWLHGNILLSGDYIDENTIPLLFCHGNGGWLGSDQRWVFFRKRPGAAQYAMLLFDYRGYGYSDEPQDGLTEQGFYEDARSARAFLVQYLNNCMKASPSGLNPIKANSLSRRIFRESDVVLMGHSLGGAVAVELAQDGTPSLILFSTFDSMPSVVRKHCCLIPAGILLRSQFDSVSKIGKSKAALLQFHGDCDATVPLQCAENLYQASVNTIPPSKDSAGSIPLYRSFKRLNGGGHNDGLSPEMIQQIELFLSVPQSP